MVMKFMTMATSNLWTYSSTSPGMSKLITCFTLGMSSPRAATAVATMIGVCPTLNLSRS